MKILVVDDEESAREINSAMLTGAGYEVELASDGNEAIHLYTEHGPYDLVVTDNIHPGPNGIELVKAIRHGNPLQLVALLTGDRSVRRCLPEEMKDIPILTKPYQAPQLIKLVKELFRLNRPI